LCCPQAAFEHLLLRGRDVLHADSRGGSRPAAVPSKHMTPAQAIRYDMDSFKSFLEKQCMQLSASGMGVQYDFGKAQDRIVDKYLLGLPVIEMELPLFAFSLEQSLNGNLEQLKQKIKQVNPFHFPSNGLF
jgi:hypothetical protein